MCGWLLSGVLGVFLVGSAFRPAEDPNIDQVAEQKLRFAFGTEHKGVRDARIKFRLKDPNYVFACDTFEVEADGWVKLTPGYLAQFTPEDKERLGSKWEAPYIRLQLDPPAKAVGDLARSRIKSMMVPSALFQDFGKP